VLTRGRALLDLEARLEERLADLARDSSASSSARERSTPATAVSSAARSLAGRVRHARNAASAGGQRGLDLLRPVLGVGPDLLARSRDRRR
jgi:hypothetical protein